MKENEGKFDFLALVLDSVLGRRERVTMKDSYFNGDSIA